MKKLDSFEVFRAIKDELRLLADICVELDTYSFYHLFHINNEEYRIIFNYNTNTLWLGNLTLYTYEGYFIDVNNEIYLRGLIMGCLFDTYR